MTTDSKAGTAERVIQRLENANAGGFFHCEADREEAIEIVAEEISAALASTAGDGAGDWVTVPRKITMPMGMKFYEHRARDEDAQFCWEAMIEAAPAVPASPRTGPETASPPAPAEHGTKVDGKLYANVSTQPFQCPHCDCRSYARVGERKGDGDYRPGLLIRCVECKAVYRDANAVEFPIPAPEHGAEIRERVEAILRDQIVLRTFHGGYSFMEGFEQAAEAVISSLSQGGGAGRSEKGEGDEEGRDFFGDLVVIWSERQGRYWKAPDDGTTKDLKRAAVHRRADAEKIAAGCPWLRLIPIAEAATPAPAQSPSTSDAEG